MKIIDEKGRLFGKINLIDLISMRKYLAKWNVDVDLSNPK